MGVAILTAVMKKQDNKKRNSLAHLPEFQRKFFGSQEEFTYIGSGSIGGKARGLVFIRDILEENFKEEDYPGIRISIPTMTVIATDIFDEFMKLNTLHDIASLDLPDEKIARAFQETELPPRIVGDLWALISKVRSPLAIRSSSLLEDARFEPLAGIYATKMIPNNQHTVETRFKKLIEAVKFVYASTFFKNAKSYFQATGRLIQEEKMAVIIQEVVGQRFNERFYPHISGVARSFNFYPTGHAQPEDGIVSLALGLGKSVVDEGIAWSYSPAYPRANPPYNSPQDLLEHTQKKFWAVNMAKMFIYNPVKEEEYLEKADLKAAELDNTLRYVASVYDTQSDRIYPGAGSQGIKVVNFAPILQLEQLPLNNLVREILQVCEQAVGTNVEIEFAISLNSTRGFPLRFGFLQVRPMVVSGEEVDILPEELHGERVLTASKSVMGNGIIDYIDDLVFIKPQTFDMKNSQKIASEVDAINKKLVGERRPYLLMGFGRWGSQDPWLGIPVNWSQIAGAKVIVEATLPETNIELSQGTHFFHNISSFKVSYFSIKPAGPYKIDWEWLLQQPVEEEVHFVRHVKLPSPVTVKVDGRKSIGVILK